jgi:hypothetical protein
VAIHNFIAVRAATANKETLARLFAPPAHRSFGNFCSLKLSDRTQKIQQ